MQHRRPEATSQLRWPVFSHTSVRPWPTRLPGHQAHMARMRPIEHSSTCAVSSTTLRVLQPCRRSLIQLLSRMNELLTGRDLNVAFIALTPNISNFSVSSDMSSNHQPASVEEEVAQGVPRVMVPSGSSNIQHPSTISPGRTEMLSLPPNIPQGLSLWMLRGCNPVFTSIRQDENSSGSRPARRPAHFSGSCCSSTTCSYIVLSSPMMETLSARITFRIQ